MLINDVYTLQETGDLPGGKCFAGSFLSGTPQRISLPKARVRDSRQRITPGKEAFVGGQAPGKV